MQSVGGGARRRAERRTAPLSDTDLRAVFNRWDANKCGWVDYVELRRALSGAGLNLNNPKTDEILQFCDEDTAGGSLDIGQFGALVRRLESLDPLPTVAPPIREPALEAVAASTRPDIARPAAAGLGDSYPRDVNDIYLGDYSGPPPVPPPAALPNPAMSPRTTARVRCHVARRAAAASRMPSAVAAPRVPQGAPDPEPWNGSAAAGKDWHWQADAHNPKEEAHPQYEQLQSQGKPYHPANRARRDAGRLPRELPDTIYSALFCFCLSIDMDLLYRDFGHGALDASIPPDRSHPRYKQLESKRRKHERAVTLKARAFAVLVLALPFVLALTLACAVQFVTSYYLVLTVLNGDENLSEGCTDETAAVLRVVVLGIFASSVARDLLETWDMHLWVKCFPTSKSFKRLRVREWVDTADRKNFVRLPEMGLTRAYRAAFYGLVLIKAGLALIVFAGGAGVLLHSPSNFELVLNTLAAEFVLNIDEMAHRLFISRSMRVRSVAPVLHAMHAERVSEYATAWKCANYMWYDIAQFVYIYVPLGLIAALGGAAHAGWCSRDDRQ